MSENEKAAMEIIRMYRMLTKEEKKQVMDFVAELKAEQERETK